MALLEREYQLSLGVIDPEFKNFLDSTVLPSINYNDIEEFRAMANSDNGAISGAASQCPQEIRITELKYPTRDGSEIRAKLYQPVEKPDDGSPLIVMYHGGGFCVGSPEDEELTCLNFVRAFGAVCLAPTYRLAPEFKFPYAPMDAWDALKWAATNAKTWDADPSLGFVVAGASAGGNIASVLAHVARDEDIPHPLTGQFLARPAVLPVGKIPEKYKQYILSYEQNNDAPVLPVAAMNMVMKAYQPDEEDGVWYASFNHPKGHKGLPPAYFQVDGMDPLRDEALVYERVLHGEGVKTKINVYPGMPHGHVLVFPFLKGSEKYRKEQVDGMGWLLNREPDFSRVVVKPGQSGA